MRAAQMPVDILLAGAVTSKVHILSVRIATIPREQQQHRNSLTP